MPQYIQAWECTGPTFNGYVYTSDIALDKLAAGCTIKTLTIVRHDNGDREYLPGTIANAVRAYREGMNHVTLRKDQT